jgi:hypothetical protein
MPRASWSERHALPGVASTVREGAMAVRPVRDYLATAVTDTR